MWINNLIRQKKVSTDSTNEFHDKVVVITGSGKGIGLAIAEHLASRGAHIVGISRNNSDLKKRLSKFKSIKTLILENDITSEKEVNQIKDRIFKKFDKVDVLINNAGVNVQKPLEETSASEFDSMVTTNIKGVFLMSKIIIPSMKKNKNGFIVNIGSKISHNTQVLPNKVIYATTKYALEGFSFALNRELKKFGIRVSCLMPGTVNTFFSLKSADFLSTTQVAEFIGYMMSHEDIDFESVIIKSKRQDI